jgi:rsbT co-antagonist protein RsbR
LQLELERLRARVAELERQDDEQAALDATRRALAALSVQGELQRAESGATAPSAGFEFPESLDARFLMRLIEETGIYFALIDREGRYLYANEATLRFLGKSARELRGTNAFLAVPPEHRAAALANLHASAGSAVSESAGVQNEVLDAHGGRHVFLSTIRPQRGEAGELIGFAVFSMDISATQVLARALAESEARLRAVYATMHDPTITIDAAGRVLSASDSVEAVLGWSPNELLSEGLQLLMPEPLRRRHMAALAEFRRTGASSLAGGTLEFDVLCKGGGSKTCRLSISRADVPGGDACFTGTLRDETDRLRAQSELALSERRFRGVFEQAFQLVCILGPQGELLDANRTCLAAMGAEKDEVLGLPLWDLPGWAWDAGSAARLQDAVHAAQQGRTLRFEVDLRGRDGRSAVIDLSLKPVHDGQGALALLVAEGRDIGELKRAQRGETAMLRALAILGESAAMLAHEVKSPITAVNLALRAVAQQLGTDQREVLEDLVGRLQRLEHVMQRTLSFSRPLELRPEAFEVEPFLEQILSELRGEVAGAGIRIECEVRGRHLWIEADRQLAQELIANLVRNSLEAGCGHVLASARPDAQPGLVRFTVDDDGPGIAPHVREELFKPFVTTKSGGTSEARASPSRSLLPPAADPHRCRRPQRSAFS